MKKINMCLFCMIALLLATILASCKSEISDHDEVSVQTESNSPALSVEEDYFTLCCENSDVLICASSGWRSVVYELISAFPITDEMAIEVAFDKDVALEVFFEASETVHEPDNISLITFQKDNWNEISQELLACEDENSAQKLIVGQFASFEKINNESGPKLYTGLLTIRFDISELREDIVLEQLNVSVNGHSRSYDIGKISLSTRTFSDIDHSLSTYSVAKLDMNVEPSAEGTFVVPSIDAEVKEDIILQGVSFHDESILVKQVEVTRTTTDGETISFKWDMSEPIELKKGEYVIFDIVGEHPCMAHSLTANVQFHVFFHYGGELAGKYQEVELTYRRRLSNPFRMYIQMETGKDVLSYYEEYMPAEAYWYGN